MWVRYYLLERYFRGKLITYMKKTVDWLNEDLHIFRSHYLKCDSNDKKEYRKGLIRYKGRFDSQGEFLSWYLSIVN